MPAHGTKQQKNNIVSYLILQFSKNNTMMDYALRPAPPPPLLLALSGRRKGHSFYHASRRGLPPCHRSCSRKGDSFDPLVRVRAKETRSILLFVSSGQREGHSLDRASWPTTLPPLLFALLCAKVTHLIACCGPPPCSRSRCRVRRSTVQSRVTASPVAKREGHLFDHALQPAPLPLLLPCAPPPS